MDFWSHIKCFESAMKCLYSISGTYIVQFTITENVLEGNTTVTLVSNLLYVVGGTDTVVSSQRAVSRLAWNLGAARGR